MARPKQATHSDQGNPQIVGSAYWIVLIDYSIFKMTRKLNNCCMSAAIKFY